MTPEPARAPEVTSDADRMLAVRRGDLGAFEQLMDEYKDPLFAYLVRMVGDRAWAEDLCQETFLRIYRNREEYAERMQFRAWMYRIARNIALDFLRREKLRVGILARGWASTRAPAGPPEILDARELEAAIGRAILELPVKFRNVFVLCALEGLSYEEVGEIEGCPAKTVSSRLARARERFARHLSAHVREESHALS